MNLVALEYVAARGERGGTLILSEFAGAAHCLPGARLVSPHSIGEVADALREALEQTPEPSAFAHMLRFVNENTSAAWARKFLAELESSAPEVRASAELLKIDAPDVSRLIRGAKRPTVLLDYDGTLRSYVVNPRDAVPSPRILRVLARLAEHATVYVISGRSREVLERWLGHLPIGLVSEHGLAIRAPGGEFEQRVRVSGNSIRELVEPIFNDFVRRTPGSSVEHKEAAIAWHYRAADPEFASFQVHELLTVLEDLLKRRPYNVLHGNRVVEVRHRNVTKGQAVANLLKRHVRSDFLFCAGDDRTDEEMMAAIPRRWKQRTITCWVGSRNPHARYWVDSNLTLLDALERMCSMWEQGGPAAKRSAARAQRRAE
jgi:trehalose 6-phosphate synthase/phosphatase